MGIIQLGKTQNLKKTILQHSLLWLFIFIGYSLILSTYIIYPNYLYVNFINIPMFMAAYYLLRYVQIPHLYNKGRTVLFGLSVLASALTFYVINATIWVSGMDAALGQEGHMPYWSPSFFLLKTIRWYSPSMVLLVWESQIEQKKERARLQELEKEKLATELKFLKAQINPHFLFNTLNNLYSYVVTESPKAPDMILRLSGILDYVFNKSQNKTVPLGEEIDTIENFLGLEKIRYGDRLLVNYNTEGNRSTPISPLILLSIIENAFKHGASGDIDTPKINIDIKEQDGVVHCNVWNTKSKLKGELNDAYKKGIGLKNIKRQLNLIYPDSYDLKINDEKTSFNVSLEIQSEL